MGELLKRKAKENHSQAMLLQGLFFRDINDKKGNCLKIQTPLVRDYNRKSLYC
jgi:hypothetical protein